MNDLINQDYDYLFKVLLLGDSGTGKSSLVLRYTDNIFQASLISSIGVDFKIKKKEIDGKKIKIQVVSLFNNNYKFKNIVGYRRSRKISSYNN